MDLLVVECLKSLIHYLRKSIKLSTKALFEIVNKNCIKHFPGVSASVVRLEEICFLHS